MPTDNINPAVVSNVKPTVNIKNLTEKAIIISIKVGMFTGQKKDKKASQEVATNNSTDANSVRVWKSLLRGEELKNLQNQAQKIRLTYYRLTSCWNDNERICKITSYLEVKQHLEKEIREYYDLAQVAIAAYDGLVNKDKQSLGDLFNIADYPSKVSFASAFYAHINVKPVESNDFRSGMLDDAEVAAINKEIENRIDNAIKTSQKDNLNRVHETLNKLVERILVSEEGRFHASTVTNVIDAINEARNLNIDDDKNMSGLLDKVEASIKQIDPVSVRDTHAGRSDALIAAKQSVYQITKAMEDLGFDS